MSEYKSSVFDRLSELLVTGKYSDTQFLLNNGDTIKGHKLIYAISSPVFDAMFYGDLAETGDIEIEDVRPEAFKTMTEFIYTDKLELNSVSHATSVYQAGDKYDVPNLAKLTEEFIGANVNAENCLEVLEFSKLHDKKDIEQSCVKLIQDNTEAVLSSDKFLDCKLCTLETIVKEEKLNVNEVELFNRVNKWANNYLEKAGVSSNDVCNLMNNVISNLRFLSMSLADFVSCTNKTDLLTTEEKYSLILNISVPNSAPLPDIFSKCAKSRTGEKLTFTSLSTNLKRNKVKWRKQDASKVVCDEYYFSPTFYMENNPFSISFVQKVKDGNKWLGLYLKCDCKKEIHGVDWSCSVDFSFKISRKHGEPEFKKTNHKFFCGDDYALWGWGCFLSWKNLIDGGYVEDDDSVVIELDARIKE